MTTQKNYILNVFNLHKVFINFLNRHIDDMRHRKIFNTILKVLSETLIISFMKVISICKYLEKYSYRIVLTEIIKRFIKRSLNKQEFVFAPNYSLKKELKIATVSI